MFIVSEVVWSNPNLFNPLIVSKRLQDVFKTSSMHLQDPIPKTFSRCLLNAFKTCRKNVKTSSRRLQDVPSR